MRDSLVPVVAVGWLIVLGFRWWLFPLKVCGRCNGTKELADGRNRRVCPRCSGTGRILRIGRTRR